MNSLSKQFTTTTLVLIPVAIALNIAVGQTIYNLGVPLYLDSIGTILVGVLAGPAAGALTGLLGNIIWGLTINPVSAPFAAVGAIIGLAAGLIGEAGWAHSWWKAIIAGLIVGLISALASAPISAFVYGGVTGNLGNDALVAAYRGAFSGGVLPAAFAQGVSSDPLDKAISFLIVWLIITALPTRFRARFPQGVPPAKA
jgi:energy-coupling factor transport system substrate-specific component